MDPFSGHSSGSQTLPKLRIVTVKLYNKLRGESSTRPYPPREFYSHQTWEEVLKYHKLKTLDPTRYFVQTLHKGITARLSATIEELRSQFKNKNQNLISVNLVENVATQLPFSIKKEEEDDPSEDEIKRHALKRMNKLPARYYKAAKEEWQGAVVVGKNKKVNRVVEEMFGKRS